MSYCNLATPNNSNLYAQNAYVNNVDSVSFQPGFYDGDPNVDLNIGLVKAETIRIGNEFTPVLINNVLYDSAGNVAPVSETILTIWGSTTMPSAPSSNYFLQKVGDAVTISLQDWQTTSGGGADSLILSENPIPEAYWPAIAKLFNVDVIEKDTVKRGSLKINTDGIMQLGVGLPDANQDLTVFSSTNGQITGLISCSFCYSIVY